MTFARFLKNTSGNVSVMLAASVFAAIGFAGAAIDFIRADNVRTTLNAAADAAALGAVTFIKSKPDATASEIKSSAKAEALRIWDSNLTEDEKAIASKLDVDIQEVSGEWAVAVTYKGKLANSFLGVLGVEDSPVAGKSVASAANGFRYWNFTFAVDTSSSMGIGATQADMNAMNADPTVGCMFACHYDPAGNDTMGRARQAGYKLRLDVVDHAIDKSIDFIKSKSSIKPQAALFGITTNAAELVPMTTHIDDVKNHAIQIALTSASIGNTNYRSALEDLTAKVNTSGDGSVASKAREVVIIVTDGIHDGNSMEPNVVFVAGMEHQLGPVDPAFCNGLKSKGALVGVLYINYITPSGYEDWIGPYEDRVKPNLQACASDGFFRDASNVSELDAAMQDIMSKALESEVRLTQ